MSTTIATYVGNGTQTDFAFSFDYLRKEFVKVLVDGSEVPYSFHTPQTVKITPAPKAGKVIIIRRDTDRARLVTFVDGSVLLAGDLNVAQLQAIHIAAEALDAASGSLLIDQTGAYSAGFRRLANLGDPVQGRDAVTKEWAETSQSATLGQTITAKDQSVAAKDAAVAARDAAQASQTASSNNAATATTKASEAAASATTATTKASEASTSATSAAASATTATTQAGIATTGANTATTKASEAAASAAQVNETNFIKRAGDTLTGGFVTSNDNDGTASGTYTPSPSGGHFKQLVNNAAFTLAAPTAADCFTLVVEVTNGATAGAITFTGFSRVFGDDLTTTDGHKFQLFICKTVGGVTCSKVAMQ